MRNVQICIGSIPVWVWLFLAATQALTLVAATARMSSLEQALQRMPDTPDYIDVREGFEANRREDRLQLACAAVLAPLFLGAAFWRWSHSSSDPARRNPSAADATSKEHIMGLFYTNLTVYRPGRPALLTQLRRLRRTAFLGPTAQGYTVVFDEAVERSSGAIERLGIAVTGALSCSALGAALHDDDVLYLWLFQKGRVRDRYDSSPAYFDPDAEPRPPAGDDAKRICRVFDCLAQHARVDRLLRAELPDEGLPEVDSELSRHEALARELGIPWFVAGLGYAALAGGYVAEKFQGVSVEAV